MSYNLRLVLFTVMAVGCFQPTRAQEAGLRALSKEISLVVDNDYPYMTDQYYTAGHNLAYRFIPASRIPIFTRTDSSKTIFSIHYGNKAFTPKNVDTKDTHLMDRPYCGWSYISAEIRHFKTKNVSNQIGLQVGMVGPDSGMGQLQQWIHKTINLYSIEGWDSQIGNEVVINANINHTQGFQLDQGAEFISSSSASVGTGNNRLSQEFTLRLFQFNPLSQSSFADASISGSYDRARKAEFYLFASVGGDYVISNIFIQGSLFDRQSSSFNTTINPWLFSQKIGVKYAGSRISLGLTFVHLGQETPTVGTHNYASANAAYRF